MKWRHVPMTSLQFLDNLWERSGNILFSFLPKVYSLQTNRNNFSRRLSCRKSSAWTRAVPMQWSMVSESLPNCGRWLIKWISSAAVKRFFSSSRSVLFIVYLFKGLFIRTLKVLKTSVASLVLMSRGFYFPRNLIPPIRPALRKALSEVAKLPLVYLAKQRSIFQAF